MHSVTHGGFLKRVAAMAAGVSLAFSPGCQKQAPPETAKPAPKTAAPAAARNDAWFHLRFAGGDALANSPDAAKLNQIAKLPATLALRRQTVQRLALALPEKLWQKTNSPALVEKISPLFDDLFHAELAVAATGPTNQEAWTLALKLSAERAQVWQTSLRAFFNEGSGHAPTELRTDGQTGWLAQEGAVRFLQAGPWTLLSWSAAPLKDEAGKLIQMLGQTGTNSTWLELNADLARVGRLLSLPATLNLPRLELTASGKNDDLRTRFRGVFASAPGWRLEPWLVPTNTIQDPVNSFTAIRGTADRFKAFKPAEEFGLHEANQLYFWAQTDLPYQSYAAYPLANATNQVRQMPARVERLMAPILAKPGNGRLLVTTNGTILWRDAVPVLMPFLRAAPEPGDNFVLWGVFPTEGEPKPLPPELLAQFVGKTNVLYYDWEITESRLNQWRQLAQLATMFAGQLPMPGTAAGADWLQAVAPLLGNTVTEITVVSPQEISGVRKSHLGLTAIEILALTQWLDNPAFPGWRSPFAESPGGLPSPIGPGLPGRKP